jgi:hypothetical protein
VIEYLARAKAALFETMTKLEEKEIAKWNTATKELDIVKSRLLRTKILHDALSYVYRVSELLVLFEKLGGSKQYMDLINMAKSTARYTKVKLDVLQPLNIPPSAFCRKTYCAQIVGASSEFWTLGAPIKCETCQGFDHPERYGDLLKCVTCPGCETMVEGEGLVKLYHRSAYQLAKAMSKWTAGMELGWKAFSGKWEAPDF